MAGLKVVPVKTHADGNLDLEDLRIKAEKHKEHLAAFMVSDYASRPQRYAHATLDHVPVDFRCLRARRPGREFSSCTL